MKKQAQGIKEASTMIAFIAVVCVNLTGFTLFSIFVSGRIQLTDNMLEFWTRVNENVGAVQKMTESCIRYEEGIVQTVTPEGEHAVVHKKWCAEWKRFRDPSKVH
jgi:ABC-type long-subunit fatty acid transport system fused permease/ATPase subunit